MVAFHEQHLRDSLAPVIQRRRIDSITCLTFRGRHSAGRYVASVDIDCTACNCRAA